MKDGLAEGTGEFDFSCPLFLVSQVCLAKVWFVLVHAHRLSLSLLGSSTKFRIYVHARVV